MKFSWEPVVVFILVFALLVLPRAATLSAWGIVGMGVVSFCLSAAVMAVLNLFSR